MVPSWLAPFYRDEELVDTMAIGIDVVDGVECHVIAANSHPDEVGTRGFTRVWVAPERDFGVLRFEYVREDPGGGPGLSRIDRSSSWVQAQPSRLWVPMVVQSDHFDYGADGTAIWEYSTLYVAQRLTVAEELPEEAFELGFPFDTRVRNMLTGEFVPNPTLNLPEILHRIRFQEPDALGREIGGRLNVIDALIAE
jgi:hypothetical protein